VDYWYPHEGELFKRLDKRLLDMYGPDTRHPKPAGK
jgi:hypothetical protein